MPDALDKPNQRFEELSTEYVSPYLPKLWRLAADKMPPLEMRVLYCGVFELLN